MASSPITSWQTEGEKVEAVTDFLSWGSKITVDGTSTHEIRRPLLLGRKAMANLDSVLKSKDITSPAKVCIVKAMVFPVDTPVMDVAGDGSKVGSCEEQYCLGTWNLRSMNQGKFSSVHFSHSVMSDSLRLHGQQHTRLPCPSSTPRVYLNSCPLSW